MRFFLKIISREEEQLSSCGSTSLGQEPHYPSLNLLDPGFCAIKKISSIMGEESMSYRAKSKLLLSNSHSLKLQ